MKWLPFAEKDLLDGKKLYRRVRGSTFTLNASGTTTLSVANPYAKAKINEVSLCWFPEGVTADFKVKDTAAGSYSGAPNYTLDQFGYGVAISKDFHHDKSQYDAEVLLGMVIEITLTNSTAESKTVGINIVFHEMI